jgi:lipoate-protein ligase A
VVNVGKCIYKVPNGKLIKVTVEHEDDVIVKIKITGDFFIHPEESIDDLELALKNQDFNRKSISDVVTKFFVQDDLVAFGITPQAVIESIMKCRRGGL